MELKPMVCKVCGKPYFNKQHDHSTMCHLCRLSFDKAVKENIRILEETAGDRAHTFCISPHDFG